MTMMGPVWDRPTILFLPVQIQLLTKLSTFRVPDLNIRDITFKLEFFPRVDAIVVLTKISEKYFLAIWSGHAPCSPAALRR